MKCRYTKEDLEKAVEDSLSIAGVCRILGIRPIGGNYRTLKHLISKYNLDTSHFTGQGWNKGSKYHHFGKKFNLDEILVENSPYKSVTKLKNRLIKEGIKEWKCECCGLTKWQESLIPLELHHINGINTDNRIENIQLLRPNCHAITENYRGKNIKSALSEKREVEFRKFKEALTENADGNLEPSLIEEGAETRHGKPKSKKNLQPKFCSYCGKELIGKERRQQYCSQECYHKANGSKRPDVFTLLNDFKELKSFVRVGSKYNVTDNAVRKWCRLYGILDMVKE